MTPEEFRRDVRGNRYRFEWVLGDTTAYFGVAVGLSSLNLLVLLEVSDKHGWSATEEDLLDVTELSEPVGRLVGRHFWWANVSRLILVGDGAPETVSDDRFPHVCLRCGKKGYRGFGSFEHQDGGTCS